jgi:hypothetical protein
MPTFLSSDLDKFEQWLNTELMRATRRGMHSGALRTVQIITTKLIPRALPHPPVDRGIYRAAWRVEASGESGPIEIVNNAPHAVFIEYGVRAANVKIGRKMIAALTEWAKRHGASGRPTKTSAPKPTGASAPKTSKPQKNEFAKAFEKMMTDLAAFIKRLRVGAANASEGKQKKVEPMSDAAATRMAWAIAMAMKKRGIFKGTGLRIAEQARKDMVGLLEKEIAREITRTFR